MILKPVCFILVGKMCIRDRVEGVYKVAFESLWENCFSEMGYREFKRDLYNGNLFEGVRAAAVGKHDVLLKESAADILSLIHI